MVDGAAIIRVQPAIKAVAVLHVDTDLVALLFRVQEKLFAHVALNSALVFILVHLVVQLRDLAGWVPVQAGFCFRVDGRSNADCI